MIASPETETAEDVRALLGASEVQKRFALMDSLAPDSVALNLASRVLLEGEWDEFELVKNIRNLVARYEILRTNLVRKHDRILQAVRPETAVFPDITVEDLTSQPSEAASRAIQKLENRYARKTFDISKDWLLRVHLVRETKGRLHVIVVMHHCIADALTLQQLLRQILHFDDDSVGSQRQPSRYDFADYLAWKSENADQDKIEIDMAFWRQALGDVPEPLQIGVSETQSKPVAKQGARLQRILPQDVSVELDELSLATGLSVASICMAAFAIVLQSRTQSKRMIIGLPYIDQDGYAMGVVGPLLDMLPISVEIPPEQSFVHVAQQIQKNTRLCTTHASPGLDRLVKELAPPRKPGQTPFFNAVFTEDPGQFEANFSSDRSVSVEEIETGQVQFDIAGFLRRQGATRVLSLQYAHDFCNEAQADAFLGGMFELLKAVLIDPSRSIRSLPVLDPDEAERVRLILNGEQISELPPTDILSQLKSFAEDDGRIALTEGDHSISFSELYNKVESLAHGLSALEPGRIAIRMSLSIDAVVVMFASLASGRGFVPLDENLPVSKIAAIVRDAECSCILTDRDLRLPSVEVHTIESLLNDAGGEDVQSLTCTQHQDIAYIIYTSGSTGAPKGIETTRENLDSFLAALDKLIMRSNGMAWLALTPISFDMSIIEIFWTLSRGVRVTIVRSRQLMSGETDFFAAVDENDISHFITTPAVMRALATGSKFKQAAKKLQFVMLGGERFDPETAQLLHSCVSGPVLNTYGPTETTVFCISHQIRGDEKKDVPIGRPVAGMTARVEDSCGRFAAFGVAGELLINGGQVTNGYWRLPDLTRSSFVEVDGKIWYRTGDLVSLHDDGLHFHGRLDRQLKIGGNRIEPGAVEAVLKTHSQIDDAVCIPDQRESGNSRLVAFIKPASDPEDPLVTQLKSLCESQLPSAARPSHYMVLEHFPKLTSGKIDQKSLLKVLDQNKSSLLKAGFRQPMTPAEAKIHSAWIEILGHSDFNLDDAFLEIGGTSMELLLLLDDLGREFSVPIDAAAILEAGSIRKMAKLLEPVSGSAVHESHDF